VKKTVNILQKAEAVVYGRGEAAYGPPKANMTTIAEMWESYLRRRGIITVDEAPSILPRDVSNMMVLLKVSREANTFSEENLVDIAGYAAVGERVAKEG